MAERMVGDVGPRDPPGTHENWGPTLLKEFDEDPGEGIIEKGAKWGKRGLIAGVLAGSFHAGVIEPPPNVNGLTYALRHMGVAGLMAGSAGMVLGVGIPVAQAIRKKNDPWAWAWGGFAAGSMFGLRSGRMGLALKVGSFLGLCLLVTKATGSYKDPYTDYYRYLRAPAPKHIKLLDENGQIILNPH